MAIVVQILSRSDKPIKHFYFDKPSITIGRAFDADLGIG